MGGFWGFLGSFWGVKKGGFLAIFLLDRDMSSSKMNKIDYIFLNYLNDVAHFNIINFL